MKVFCVVSGVGVTRGKWYEVLGESPNYYYLEGTKMRTGVKKEHFLTFKEFTFLGLDEKDYQDDCISTQESGHIENNINLTKQLSSNINELNIRDLKLKGINGFKLKLKIMKGEKLTDTEKLILFSLIDEEESHCNLKR